MKFYAISLLAAAVSGINIKDDAPSNSNDIPTVVYAGMNSKCSDPGYVSLVSKI